MKIIQNADHYEITVWELHLSSDSGLQALRQWFAVHIHDEVRLYDIHQRQR